MLLFSVFIFHFRSLKKTHVVRTIHSVNNFIFYTQYDTFAQTTIRGKCARIFSFTKSFSRFSLSICRSENLSDWYDKHHREKRFFR